MAVPRRPRSTAGRASISAGRQFGDNSGFIVE
jgi:hypothetical protein